MAHYFTTGQVARKLRVSVSTLKRWLSEPTLMIPEKRNYNGWRLFTSSDVNKLKEYKRSIRKKGKRFNDTTLIPAVKITGGSQLPLDGSDM
ncbi:MAG: MerR family transcriptional regulator [Fibrobacterota bacterium]